MIVEFITTVWSSVMKLLLSQVERRTSALAAAGLLSHDAGSATHLPLLFHLQGPGGIMSHVSSKSRDLGQSSGMILVTLFVVDECE